MRGTGLLAITFLLAMLGFTSTAAAAEPAVWVGSPLAATWPTGSSLPSQHHIPYNGDWSADLQSVRVGAPVVLYAAPQNGSTSVSARVEIVRPACASGVIADGGYRVTVGLFTGGTKIGSATYAHINPSVSQGATIPRWNTQLGVVGNYRSSSCWTGPHVHVELYSQHNYACYNRGWAPGQAMSPTNFIGFTGGAFASGQRAACP
ncbi:M23 family metallopeptidase [Actinophytocola algeriensis]|uniref:Peptidase M23-like protein n=1 Tax=Actinophytocola algeriensis TaxID=1768010 RepID=A0A7W7VHZ9_9PSEU|nr:hypothetical protein [Actinophytocola algeriensis]MBB4910575.1 hypothetical protein [Actinophytocola algeriensis]MBE1480436.1 hypothetical protein [Actinophytocola algeriensis]